MDFGLGLILSFTDNASSGINSAVNSLGTLTDMAEKSSASIDALANTTSLSALSVMSSQLGSGFVNMGTSIIGAFQNIMSNVQETGSTFQSLRTTVNALLKDSEKADEAISNLMNFSATTPFEINDLTGMFTTITANGLDAFQTLTGATTGYQESLMSAIGDLMAFRPDVPAQQWATAIRNAFSGEVRSLKNALDLNISDTLGREWGDSAEQVAQDFMDLADAIGVAGMMNNSMESLGTILANVGDQFTRIYLAIADTGVFDLLQQSVSNLATALGEISGDTLVAFSESVGGALKTVMTPIVNLTNKLADLIRGFTQFVAQNPRIVKLATVIAGVSAVLLIMTGVVLKAISSLAGICIVLQTFGGTFSSMASIVSSGIIKIMSVALPLAIAMVALYKAWQSDFAGIRTMTTNFLNNVISSFNTAKQAVSGSVNDMITTLNDLRNQDNFFSGLTIGFMKLLVFLQAFQESWNTYTLSEDTFEKAKELGILPLIEAILDLKYRFDFFKQGFIDGWREIGDKVQAFVTGIADNVDGTFLETMLDNLTTFLDKLGSGDIDTWYEFGRSFADFTANALLFFAVFKTIDSVIGKVVALATVFKLFKGAFDFASIIGGAFTSMLPSITTALAGIEPLIGKALGNIIGLSLPSIQASLQMLGSQIMNTIIAVLGTLGAPVLAIIGAILASVIAYAVTNFEDFKSKVMSVLDTFVSNVQSILDTLKEGVMNMVDSVVNAVTPFIQAILNLKDKIVELLGVIGDSSAFQTIITFLSYIGEAIMNVVVPVLNALMNLVGTVVKSIINIVVSVFTGIVSVVGSILTGLVNIISGILDIIIGVFTGDFGRARDGVITIFGSIMTVITSIMGAVLSIIMTVLSSIVNVFTSILTGAFNIVTGIFKGILTTIEGVLTLAFESVRGIFEGIFNIIESVLGSASDTVTQKFQAIKDTIFNLINGAKDVVFNAIEAIKGFFDFEWSLPSLKMPHFNITGGFSLNPPSVPSVGVDWYAKGGVFDEPNVIGVGESGKEAVVPLENNTGWISDLASNISGMLTPQNTSSSSDGTMISLLSSCASALNYLVQLTASQNAEGSYEVVNPQTQTSSVPVNNSYLTTNNNQQNTNTSSTPVNNSVTFAEGSIQIIAQNSSQEEMQRMAEYIMQYIKRQQELDDMTKYK